VLVLVLVLVVVDERDRQTNGGRHKWVRRGGGGYATEAISEPAGGEAACDGLGDPELRARRHGFMAHGSWLRLPNYSSSIFYGLICSFCLEYLIHHFVSWWYWRAGLVSAPVVPVPVDNGLRQGGFRRGSSGSSRLVPMRRQPAPSLEPPAPQRGQTFASITEAPALS